MSGNDERKIRKNTHCTVAPDLGGRLTIVSPAQHPPTGLQASGHP
eukprot:SAG31_NODE_29923_length_388_cov_0.709343_2_plen_44_part_01